jgi:ATP-dependent DNA helicase RecG
MPQLRLARVLKHQTVIKSARDEAVALLDADPDLTEPEHQALRREMEARFPPGALEVLRSG